MKRKFLLGIIGGLVLTGCTTKNVNLDYKDMTKHSIFKVQHTLYVPYNSIEQNFENKLVQKTDGTAFRFDTLQAVNFPKVYNKYYAHDIWNGSKYKCDKKKFGQEVLIQPVGNFVVNLLAGIISFGMAPIATGFETDRKCLFSEKKFNYYVNAWLDQNNISDQKRRKILDLYNKEYNLVKQDIKYNFKIVDLLNARGYYWGIKKHYNTLFNKQFPCYVDDCLNVLNNNYKLLLNDQNRKLKIISYIEKHGVDMNSLHYIERKYTYNDNLKDLIKSSLKWTQSSLNDQLLDALYNIKKIKILLKKGADVNARGRYDYTPLIFATRDNKFKIVKLLVNNGANVNIAGGAGFTALMGAVGGANNYKMVKFLIDHGADVNAVISSPVSTSVLDYVKSYKIAKLLLDNGANPNLTNPLVNIIDNTSIPMKERYRIVKLLIAYGADVNKDHTLSLIYAVQMENAVPLIKLLVQHGANVNTATGNGRNLAFYAKKKYIGILKQLGLKNTTYTDNTSNQSQETSPINIEVKYQGYDNSIKHYTYDLYLNGSYDGEIFYYKDKDTNSYIIMTTGISKGNSVNGNYFFSGYTNLTTSQCGDTHVGGIDEAIKKVASCVIKGYY